jgi:phospholipase D1/2
VFECHLIWLQAVSEALEHAKETIYIEDWWLSPELAGSTTAPLRRCANFVVSTSTTVLQSRMAFRSDTQKEGRTRSEDLYNRLQRGKCPSCLVITIKLTPRKVSAALTCNSQHTKKVMMNLIQEGEPGYGNIKLMRHPDHNVLENAGDMTFYWVRLPLK